MSLEEGRCPDSRSVMFGPMENSAVSYVGIWPKTDISKRKSYSIACWIKLKSYPSNDDNTQLIYSDWKSEEFLLAIQSGRVFFAVSEALNETCLRWRMKTTRYKWLISNKWTHVTATWDGHAITLYVNGEERDGRNSFVFRSIEPNISVSVESAPAFIAGNPHFNSFQFLGAIMDLYIFGIALPHDNVIEVYRGEIY